MYSKIVNQRGHSKNKYASSVRKPQKVINNTCMFFTIPVSVYKSNTLDLASCSKYIVL